MWRGGRPGQLLAVVILAAARSAPCVLHAQQPATPLFPCLDSIPTSTLRRVPVYAAAEISDGEPVSTTALGSIDLFTQAVAEEARALLGAAPGQLPPGEPSITWRQLDHQLLVVAHRDGRLAWRVPPPLWLTDQSLGDAGARHLGRALEVARQKEEAFHWDDALKADSLTWLVRLEPSVVAEDGTVTAPSLRAGFPVFTVLAPPILAADVERIRTTFPMVRIRGFSGTVRLQFVIDRSGRAIPATIREVWPATEARLAGPPAFAHDSLVRVMRLTLAEAYFVPARIGRCAISQLVQQAFTYRPAR
jgi:hypothetical protein